MFLEDEAEPRTRVKICGLTTLEHARYASGAMADFLGYIFYENSPRYIEPSEAAAIITWIEGPANVGVFVNKSIDDVNDIARLTGIQYVQLHGDESPEYCELIDKPIIKGFRVTADDTAETLRDRVQPYRDAAAYFLFDAYSPDVYGGSGKSFNWDILAEFDSPRPFLLAGGLSAENVKQAVRKVRPYGLDVSSSLEDEPGIKSFEKMETFFDTMQEIWDGQRDE